MKLLNQKSKINLASFVVDKSQWLPVITVLFQDTFSLISLWPTSESGILMVFNYLAPLFWENKNKTRSVIFQLFDTFQILWFGHTISNFLQQQIWIFKLIQIKEIFPEFIAVNLKHQSFSNIFFTTTWWKMYFLVRRMRQKGVK